MFVALPWMLRGSAGSLSDRKCPAMTPGNSLNGAGTTVASVLAMTPVMRTSAALPTLELITLWWLVHLCS